MKKHKRLIAMGLVVSFLSLFIVSGCTDKETKFKPSAAAKLMSLSISDSQMGYSFWICENDDGTVLFSAEYQPDEGGRVSISRSDIGVYDMEALRKIVDENSIVKYVKSYEAVKTNFPALDAPAYSTTLRMSDGSSITIDALCDGNTVLHSFFIKLAEKYYEQDEIDSSSETVPISNNDDLTEKGK